MSIAKLRWERKIYTNKVTSNREYKLKVSIDNQIVNQLYTNLNSLSISNIDINEFSPSILEFNMKKFSKIALNNEKFNEFTRIIHSFFDTLSDNQIKTLIRLYYISKVLIMRTITSINVNINENTESLLDSKHFNEFERVIELIGNVAVKALTFKEENNEDILSSLRKFVVNLYIPNLEEAGLRPQDTRTLTFLYSDYLDLYVLIIASKLLFPIIAELVHILFDMGIRKHFNDIAVTKIYEPLFEGPLLPIVEKLRHFIDNQIDKFINNTLKMPKYEDLALSLAYNGYSPEFIKEGVFANIVIRKFQNMEIYFQNEIAPDETRNIFNIMGKITSAINMYLDHLGGDGKNKVKHRFEDEDDEEDGKVMLDVHSYNYSSSVDQLVIVDVMVEELINNKLKQFNKINKYQFDEIVDFYMKNMIFISPYNEFIPVLLYDEDIGGSRSLKYLNYNMFIKLLTISQIELIERECSPQLVHFLTTKLSNQTKSLLTTIDSRLGSEKTMTNYKYLRKMLSHLDERVNKWEYIFDQIMQLLWQNVFLYNSHELIFKLSNTDSELINTEFKYDSKFISELVDLIFNVFKERYPVFVKEKILNTG